MGLLYTNLKVFHYKDKLNSLPLTIPEILPPLHIRIKPTNVCNHHCTYCAYRAAGLQLGKDMQVRDQIPRDKMMEILDDIIEIGVGAVTFSGGGEPFCYPYFQDAVNKLAGSRVKFASLTNGSLLRGEIAEIFAHRATWLRISMDGWDNESYSSYRHVPIGAFNTLMHQIEDFKAMGGPCYLGVSIIVDRRNAAHLFDLMHLLKERGVDSVKISPCIVDNQGVNNNAYHEKIFSIVKDGIQKAQTDLADSNFEIYDTYHHLDEKFVKDNHWCPYLQILPVIGADLRLYSCQDKAYNLESGVLGAVRNSRLKDIWFSDKKRFFNIDPSQHCNHHCVSNTKNKMVIDYLSADPEHRMFV